VLVKGDNKRLAAERDGFSGFYFRKVQHEIQKQKISINFAEKISEIYLNLLAACLSASARDILVEIGCYLIVYDSSAIARARLIARATIRWCLAQFPVLFGATIFACELINFRRRRVSL
jgi:hypothetical protein